MDENEVLNELMKPPSTTSELLDDRLLRPSEYKRVTLSRATVQSLLGSGSSVDRIVAYAGKRSENHKKAFPSVEHDIEQGRLFLEQKGSNNLSVWTHLNDILRKILSERPDNVIEYFEEYSRQVKQERYAEQSGYIQDVFMPPEQFEYSKKQLQLLEAFTIDEDVEDVAGEEDEERRVNKRRIDLIEAAYYFSQGGVHLPDTELFAINVAMKTYVQQRLVLNPRFWGKVFGSKSNYYIIECKLPEEEAALRNEGYEAEEAEKKEELEAEKERTAKERETAETLAIEEEEKLWLAAEQEEEERETAETPAVEEGEEKLALAGEQEEEERQTMTVAEEQVLDEHQNKDELNTEQETVEDDNFDSTIDKKEEFLNVTSATEETSFKPESPQLEEDPLLPPLPQPKKILTYKVPLTLKPPPKVDDKVPEERYGEGVNKKVYFVCTEPGSDWFELPRVTPQQLNAARQLKIYFTGNLNAEIDSYPAFPGTEIHYLRAQVARISAGTQISPLGFYSFKDANDEEEEEETVEEEEEEGDRNTYVENSAFEPVPLKDLVDPSLSFWVHHTQHVLKQGRVVFWSTKKATSAEEEDEEAEAEEEEDEKDKEEKEVGPPLLMPLSQDVSLEVSSPWTVCKSSHYNQAIAVAFIKSNLWPGAYAFAVDKKFENIYIGDGQKYSSQGFSPVPLPHPEYEYLLGPEIMEINDPSVEVEEEWRLKHKRKPPPKPEEEEDEEGDEEEEEEEDDDE